MSLQLIWGKKVPFGEPERKMYMVYYGIFIKSVFIGIGVLNTRNRVQPSKETLTPRMA
jgi:hypothetical protein